MKSSLVFVSLGALALTLGCSSTMSVTPDAGTNCGTVSTLCGSVCVDLKEDELNCGACGNACDAGSACSAGVCATSCPVASTLCGLTCVDLLEDELNCGACSTACDAGTVCSSGACAPTCEAGLTACGASCKDLQQDNANCGTCGATCDTTQRCAMGTCQTWQQVSDGGPHTYGLVSYTPAGADLLLTANGSSIWQYHIADGGWTQVASGVSFPSGYAYAARSGGNLYWLHNGDVYSYPSADGGVAITLDAGIPTTINNENTMDDSNNVWTVAANGQIVGYNLDAGTVSILDGGAGSPNEPRIAWDSLTNKLYFGSYSATPLYSLDPATTVVAQLISFPDSEGMNDAFCSDHRGKVFTTNNAGTHNTLFTYDAVRGIWNVSNMPFTVGSSGSCTMTGDGYLYMMDNSGNLYRLRVF